MCSMRKVCVQKFIVLAAVCVFTACTSTGKGKSEMDLLNVPQETPEPVAVPALMGPYVTYEEFGAAGDGASDDFLAIINAHNHANANSLPVRAGDGAVYYIGHLHAAAVNDSPSDTRAIIETNTYWGNARFIIDNRNISSETGRRSWIFQVRSTRDSINLMEEPYAITSVQKNQARLPGIQWEQGALVRASNQDIRFQRRDFSGTSAMNDVFKIDKDGNIDPYTPVIWNFDTLTSLTAHLVENEPLFISGGHFETIANDADYGFYHYRGILINRSNTVIDGFTHTVTGDNPTGPSSMGMIYISGVSDVTIQNTVLTGRRVTRHGTYDLGINSSTNITLINVTQSNDITDRDYWGIMGANDIKNIYLYKVRFSRYDTHRQTHNVTLKDSEFGHAGIQITGSGLLWIENTVSYHDDQFVCFRHDWGSTWDGNVYIINCTWYPNSDEVYLLHFNNNGQHQFNITEGRNDYVCSMPAKFVLDGMTIMRGNVTVNLFSEIRDGFDPEAPFVLKLPQEVVVKRGVFGHNGQSTAYNIPSFVRDNPGFTVTVK